MRPSARLARGAVALPLLTALALLPACGQDPVDSSDGSAESGGDRARDGAVDDADTGAANQPSVGQASRGFPQLAAWRQVRGLAQSWDVQVLPGTGLLVDERETGPSSWSGAAPSSR